MKRMLLAVFCVAMSPMNTWASGLQDLEVFVKTVKSGKADFVQTVTSPAKDGQAPRVKTSSGQFEFARPNRFKFTYVKPFAQTILADGQTLWLYDQDLNQVTARKQAQVLGSTPAALIASAPDINALKGDFELTAQPVSEGLEWVLATPKTKDGQLHSVRIGFKAGQLDVLEILDSFGQKSTLRFTALRANGPVDASTYQFKPPAGSDVIHQ